MNPTENCRIIVAVLIAFLVVGAEESRGQTKPRAVRVAYSAFIGRDWGSLADPLYASCTTAAQALLAGEIQFGHLSPAPMMTAWAEGADIAWVGTTIHQNGLHSYH